MIAARPPWQRDRGTAFYRACALAAIAVTFAGFAGTYLLPLAQGRFAGPAEAHVHGPLLAAWLGLLAVQSFLLPSHRWLGWLSLPLVPAIAASTVAIGVAATRRDLQQGIATGMAGNVTAPLVFGVLVCAALALRRRPQWHKRLMLIATVVILWPAWFRWRHFLAGIPRPDLWLGLVANNVPLLIAMARDGVRFGAVHPAYLAVGLPVLAWETFESLAFGSPWWSAFGLWLYRVLS